MKNLSKDQEALDRGLKLFKLAQKLLRCVGLWALASNIYWFLICMLYYNFYLVLAFMDLYESINDIDKLVDNFAETLSIIFVYARLITLYINNKSLAKIITQVLEDFNVNAFKSFDEIEVFMKSIDVGKFLLKSFIIFFMTTEIMWYISAVLSPNIVIDNNNQTKFAISYNIYIFYDINSLSKYYLTYLFLLPTPYLFGIGNVAVDSILISLLFYISGKLAVLTMRINALEQKNCRKNLKEIIAEHIKLLKLGEGTKDAYSTGLLVYLININFIICILGYKMLIFSMTGRNVELISYIFYLLEMTIMLGLFCQISEHLTTESSRCCEAFYNCVWYELPIDCTKDIIYCIERSQKPLALWAGKFTTFSNVTLTNVMKTAAGYLSVLRSFLINE